jgi:predicted small metal-binding protein
MAKEMRCRDLGIACDQVIRADSEEELIRRVAQHALMVHGIDLTEPQLFEQLKELIHAVDPTR